MRLVTHSDFDCLANVPYVEGCGLWFDHHSSEHERLELAGKYKVGYSILNRTSDVNVGSLMLKYNGGGHKAVGTCQFSDENMAEELPKMLNELCEMSNKR